MTASARNLRISTASCRRPIIAIFVLVAAGLLGPDAEPPPVVGPSPPVASPSPSPITASPSPVPLPSPSPAPLASPSPTPLPSPSPAPVAQQTPSPSPTGTQPPTTNSTAPTGTQPPTTNSPAPIGTQPPTTSSPAPIGTQPLTTSSPAPIGTQPPTTSSPAPIGTQPPTTNSPAPVGTQPPIIGQPPVQGQPPTTNSPAPVGTQPPIIGQPPVQGQPPTTNSPAPVGTQPPIIGQPPLQGQPPGTSIAPSPPALVQTTTASVTLSGISSALFGAQQRTAFASAVAALLSLSPSAVVVKSVVDAAARRHLLAAGVLVTFTIQTNTVDAANAATAALTQLTSTGAAGFISALQAAGVVVSGVALAGQPQSQETVAPPPSFGPPSSSAQEVQSAVSGVNTILNDPALNSPNATAAQVNSAALNAAALLNNLILAPSQPGGQPGGGAAPPSGGGGSGSGSDPALLQQVQSQRENLLTIVASSLGATGGGAVPGGQPQPPPQLAPDVIDSTAKAVASLTQQPTQLTPAAQSAALGALSTLARSGSNVSQTSAVLLVSSLGSVAQAAAVGAAPAANATGGGGGGTNATQQRQVLKQVLQVVDQVASGQAAQLNDTTAPPLEIVTPTIKMSLRLDDPNAVVNGTLFSRLYTQQITSNGTVAAFDPLPVGALSAANSTVRTTFVSLSFDPHATADEAAASGRSSITRLAFNNAADGSTVPVANLSVPITFTLPAVNLNSTANGTRSGGRDGSGGGSGGPYVDTSKQAVCTFYDEVAEAYSQDGCVAIPNPLPAGLTASWVAGFTANRTLDLAKSWALSDNGTAAGLLANCDMAFIDCSDPAQANVTIYPNKRLPLKYPAISCGGVTSARIIRVFNGSQCRLIDTDNQEGCYWNATSQAFSGPGCVAGNVTRCACQHLTDFASATAPKIAVCSASDLFALSPTDIITKLRFFLYLIVILFGLMHILTFLAWLRDSRDSAYVWGRLENECGFQKMGPDGAWTWFLEQDSVADDDVFQILPGKVPHAVGRQGGLSANWLGKHVKNSKESELALIHKIMWGNEQAAARASAPPEGAGGKGGSKVAPLPAGYGDAEAPAKLGESEDYATRSYRMVGTALVFGCLANRAILDAGDLAAEAAKTAKYFEGVTCSTGKDFRTLYYLFTGMLFPSNLPTPRKWLARSQLWRLIFLQNPDGSFNCTEGLALALNAHSEDQDEANDCPLTCQWQAIRDSMPEMTVGSGDNSHDTKLKIWATTLAVAVMEASSISWLLDEEENITVVDKSTAFLRKHNAEINKSPLKTEKRPVTAFTFRNLVDALRGCLTSDESDDVGIDNVLGGTPGAAQLHKLASKTVVRWRTISDDFVTRLRKSETRTFVHAGTLLQRSAGEIVRTVLVKHPTLGPFLAPLCVGFPRWQLILILGTMIMAALTIDVWLYYSKSLNCCLEVRSLLGCSSNYQEECLGYTGGDCADLPAQFSGIPDIGLPSDYTCTQFPDSNNMVHTFLAGLITFAVMLPFNLVLVEAFTQSNEPDYPDGQLSWPLLYRILFGQQTWHFQDTKPGVFKTTLTRYAHDRIRIPIVLFNYAIEAVLSKLCCCKAESTHREVHLMGHEHEWGRHAVEAGPEGGSKRGGGSAPSGAAPPPPAPSPSSLPTAEQWQKHEKHRVEHDREHVKELRYNKWKGVVLTYVAWGIMAWLIFVYGRLIYNLLGAGEEVSFVRSWLIALGIDNVTEFKQVVQQALKTVLIFMLLEPFLIPKATWFEEHCEFLSVQATLFTKTPTTWVQRMKTHIRFYSYNND